jgi:hypothetical protein
MRDREDCSQRETIAHRKEKRYKNVKGTRMEGNDEGLYEERRRKTPEVFGAKGAKARIEEAERPFYVY